MLLIRCGMDYQVVSSNPSSHTTTTLFHRTLLIDPGVRSPKRAQKVETRTVHNHELPVAEQDWGAWGSDNENDGVAENSHINNGSGVDHDMQESSIAASQTKPRESLASEGDDDDAWGWNDDEDIIVEEPLGQKNHPSKHTAQLDQANVPVNNKHSTRQVTMSEDYWTSGLPQPIMDIIKEIYEDGAKLLQPEYAYPPAWKRIACMWHIAKYNPRLPQNMAHVTILMGPHRFRRCTTLRCSYRIANIVSQELNPSSSTSGGPALCYSNTRSSSLSCSRTVVLQFPRYWQSIYI